MMMLLLLVSGLLASSVDAAITGWTEPAIEDAASGSGEVSIPIPENTPIGETGITIVANSDSDGTLTYAIINPPTPNVFTIADTGILSITAMLDYETARSHVIEVTAADGSEVSGPTATATITLIVGNVDPVFANSSQTVCASQGSPGATVITTLSATVEGGGDIAYSIEGSDPTTDTFDIDGANVIVTADKSLADIQLYTLTIHATYNDEPPASTELKIDVKADCSSASMLSPLSIVLLLVALVVSMQY